MTCFDHDDLHKATAILQRPNEDLVMHLKGFVVYAYNDSAGTLSIMNIYIPFKSQPCDLKNTNFHRPEFVPL